ncbi:MAG: dephospho-CoA kinase [Rhodospirillales bacterium]
MRILGLTGSIGMGKSTTAHLFRYLGVPVHDADATVHGLMGPGGAAVDAISNLFAGVEQNGAIDRQALGARVFGNDSALKQLEAVLHPQVRAAEQRFLAREARRGVKLVVLDIPLFFETEGEKRVDAVAVVTAPAFLQRARVMVRPGMTAEKFRAILARQVPDAEKRARADFLVQSGLGRAHALRQVRAIVKLVSGSDESEARG